MGYIKIRFCNDVDQLHSKIERSIEDVYRAMNPTFSLNERTWHPQVDIYETGEEIIVRAEVAGVDIENLAVEVSHRAIKLTGKRWNSRVLTTPPTVWQKFSTVISKECFISRYPSILKSYQPLTPMVF